MHNKQDQLLKNADNISTQAMEEAIRKSRLPIICLIALFVLLELIPNFYNQFNIDATLFFIIRLTALVTLLALVYPSIVYVKKRIMKITLSFISR